MECVEDFIHPVDLFCYTILCKATEHAELAQESGDATATSSSVTRDEVGRTAHDLRRAKLRRPRSPGLVMRCPLLCFHLGCRGWTKAGGFRQAQPQQRSGLFAGPSRHSIRQVVLTSVSRPYFCMSDAVQSRLACAQGCRA